MLRYVAALNQRQQVTFSVANAAMIYAGLGAATWRMQVRQYPEALDPPLLDSEIDGGFVYTPGAAPVVTFQWPMSAVADIPGGLAVFDFGFVLPSADFEVAGWGEVRFVHGVTEAGVVGSPAPPTGSDDTWLISGAPGPSLSPSLASVIAATAAEEAAAAAAATAAAASATAAAASAAAAAVSAAEAQAASAGNAATLVTAIAALPGSELLPLMQALVAALPNVRINGPSVIPSSGLPMITDDNLIGVAD